MMIRFVVKNFMSFRDHQELSLIATSSKEHIESVFHEEGFSKGLLRVAAVYGANASGKSNLLAAMRYFVSAIQDSHQRWSPDKGIKRRPFAFDESKSSPSLFQMDFVFDHTRFQYGFSLDDEKIVDEWLLSYPKGKKQTWFLRSGVETLQFKFGKSLTGENRAIESLTRRNSLFLSAAAQNNHPMLLPLYSWLTNSFHFQFGERTSLPPPIAAKLADPVLRSEYSRLFEPADLGIVGVEVREEKMEEKFSQALREFFTKIAPDQPPPVDEKLFGQIHKVVFKHRAKGGARIELNPNEESAGTLCFISLMVPALESIRDGGIFCVDELDSSLHPLLVREIIKLFNDPKRNTRNAQIVFNTHNVGLLEGSLFRRDQVWFTQKDQDGASHLYSLSDFKPRRQENVKRGYLQGRYGAVPVVGELNSLDGLR